MRPKRLEIEGFTAFRESTVVDFEGADLFAFTGPTGAGKSSLVDAIGFALYGRVHRYNDKLVYAAISTGANEVRVRFDFSIGDDDYTAVRVARRLGPGRASTKEARLERSGEVLAGDEKGLTAEITRLLGLDFEQYCRCVVLPQGAFAAFLHDTPKGRQDLLAGLLDVSHYRALGQDANQRASAAAQRATYGEERLAGDLTHATDDALAAAKRRVAELTDLRARVAAVEPQLAAQADRAKAATAELEAASRRRVTLQELVQPDGIEELADRIKTVQAEMTVASDAVAEAEEMVTKASEVRERLGDRRPLDKALDDHERRKRALGQVEQATAKAAQLRDKATAATNDGDAAEEVRARAAAAMEEARHSNQAHALVETLVEGEPCPVCRQPVREIPVAEEPADFTAAKEALEHADAEARSARDRAASAVAEAAAADAAAAGWRDQLAEADQAIAAGGHGDEASLRAAIKEIELAEQAVVDGRAAERQRRSQHRAAVAKLEQQRAAEHAARTEFESARDRVSALGSPGPPSPPRVDLAADWAELIRWAGERSTDAAAAEREAQERASAATAAEAALRDDVHRWCGEHGIDLGSGARGAPGARGPAEAVAAAEAEAEAAERRVSEAIEERRRVEAEVAAQREQERVAKLLALHLRSDHFEKWLLDEALSDLTAGATGLLRELSGGAYSLTLDSKTRDFAVVDHRNADELRAVRTLSGGETFLASLALALALAERVSEMAASGAARLEALFLDEGFGTLDAETLDTVASAIENLGSTGRVVGLVTHVRELAERVPVRFEVTKGPSTAAVERVAS